MQWDKTFPKLDGAVQALICSEAALPERLDEAIQKLSSLSENDFFLQVRGEYNQLMKQISTYQNSGKRADLQMDLARAIFHLFKKYMVEAWPPNTPV